MASSEDTSQAALDEICRRFAPRIRLYGWKHLRDRQDVEELVQRALLVVVRKLKDRAVEQPDSITSFVLGVARRQTLELNRRAQKEPLATAEQTHSLVIEAHPEPEPRALVQLGRCIERLTERERSVVVLSYFEDESSESIAKSWSTTTANVRVIRHRAVSRLRSCMDGQGAES